MIRATKADFDFSQAALYRKMESLPKHRVRRAGAEQNVTSYHSRGIETINKAQIGDYIVMGEKPDHGYVIESHRFDEIYEEDPCDPALYRAKITRLGLMTLRDVRFMSPWGEEQDVLAGGIIIEAGPYIYGIDKFSFIQRYGRVDNSPEGHCFTLLTNDLAVQRVKAAALGLVNHLSDIDLRLANPDLFVQ